MKRLCPECDGEGGQWTEVWEGENERWDSCYLCQGNGTLDENQGVLDDDKEEG